MKFGAFLVVVFIAVFCAIGSVVYFVESHEDDCTQVEVYNFDDDCGYYNSSGVFIFYAWVAPGQGGKPTGSQKPKPPRYVRTTKPTYTGPRTSNTQQLNTDTGRTRTTTTSTRVSVRK